MSPWLWHPDGNSAHCLAPLAGERCGMPRRPHDGRTGTAGLSTPDTKEPPNSRVPARPRESESSNSSDSNCDARTAPNTSWTDWRRESRLQVDGGVSVVFLRPAQVKDSRRSEGDRRPITEQPGSAPIRDPTACPWDSHRGRRTPVLATVQTRPPRPCLLGSHVTRVASLTLGRDYHMGAAPLECGPAAFALVGRLG